MARTPAAGRGRHARARHRLLGSRCGWRGWHASPAQLYSRAVSLHSLAPPPSPDPPADDPEPASLRVAVDIRSTSLFVLATVACVFMLKQMEDVLVPIVLGALIFYAL